MCSCILKMIFFPFSTQMIRSFFNQIKAWFLFSQITREKPGINDLNMTYNSKNFSHLSVYSSNKIPTSLKTFEPISAKGLLWFSLVLWHINHCRLLMLNPIFININISISNNSVWHKYTVKCQKQFYFKLFNIEYKTSSISFNAKSFQVEEQWWYNLTDSYRIKEVHTLLKGINPKENVIAWLEFRLPLCCCPSH